MVILARKNKTGGKKEGERESGLTFLKKKINHFKKINLGVNVEKMGLCQKKRDFIEK